ncbi:MFS transporter [Termitidicoccus mucosus]|uniref:MFS transporter n=1 Tax=Termitidicoccus mucosus TaxID=1184151 RepID=A0A178IQP3_9BACT|nr:MFS transporter [Opitutaceae bacterium TSB47]
MNPNPPSVARYAWVVLALLAPVALLNYMDRQMMAAMKYSLMGDVIGLDSEAKWGLLPAAFKWTYAFLSPLGGYIADRFSKKHVIVLSLFVWSAITWATGHAQTFEQLIWSRAIMGVSEACYIPAGLALIADFHTGPTRSRAVGIHQMAIYVGIMIGGFSGYVADSPSLGWRWAFDAAGLLGVAYAIPLFVFLRNAPKNPDAPMPERPSAPRAIAELLTNKYFIMMVLYFTLPGLAGWVVKDWMPAILQDQFGIGQGKAGVSATIYVNIASLIGAVVGGSLADRWMRRTDRGRIYISALGMCCIIPALFGVGNAGSLLVAVAFLALFGIGWGFFDCNNMPILCQIVRPELRATGYGVLNMVGTTCGGFADWGFGFMRDHSVPLNLIFSVFAGLCLTSATLVLLIRPNKKLLK